MTTAETETNKQLVRRWIDLANANDFAGLSEVWAPDCVLHQGEDLGDVNGFPAFRTLLESFYTGMPDLHITVDDVLSKGDLVISRTTSRATHAGEVLGIPATGRKVEYTGIATYRIVAGKIAEEWFNDDFFTLFQQLTASDQG
jgi:steroid delta-isomerase-like uncharacterized protein